MDQELIAIEADQVLDHFAGVDVVSENLVDLGHSEAFEESHHENASRRDFAIYRWDDDEIAVTKKFSEPLNILRLVMEVHFLGDDPGEFFDDCSCRTDDVVVN